jgi:hypothetical protein
MRPVLARIYAAVILVAVVLLALAFALLQN